MIANTSTLYDKLLSIYKTQNDKLIKAEKKSKRVQNTPEVLVINLYLDKDDDDLPSIPALQGDEEVKLELEETIAKKI